MHLDGDVVKSCAVLAVQADGRMVTTIEVIAQGREIHPMQEAFTTHHSLQCGFCTPGMIMAALGIVKRHGRVPGDAAIRHGLEGNICRCTGYQNIVSAIRDGATHIKTDQPV